MKNIRWALAILVAAFFIFMGSQKFGVHNPVFQYLATQSGIGLFEPTVRMATGLAEILAALLIVLPQTRRYGALLALAVLGGALAFHLSPWLGINAPMAFSDTCMAAQNCDYGDMGSYAKSPMLFVMALSFFLITLGLFLVERSAGKKPS